jgi:hypothetical protein
MTPAAAKLLMCVCAGSTGAVMVPVAHKARAAYARPAVHRAMVRAPAAAAASAIAAVPCVPLASGGGAGGLPAALPLAPPAADLGMFSPADARGAGGFARGGGGNGISGGGGFSDYGPAADMSGPLPGGVAPGGGIVDGIGGGIGGGTETPGPVVTPATVPEPAGWAMLISGFTMIGGGLRWQRRGIA